MAAFNAENAARFIADAHKRRQPYANLPDELAPQSIADAYAAQEALRHIWEPIYGPVDGLKIATTTKVMQALMGIDHPCGGMLYRNRIHTSGSTLTLADHMHLVLEAELAVRVNATLDGRDTPYTRENVRAFVAEAMPAYELIEDRNAHYKSTKAFTLIADNAWNAGIVLGPAVRVSPGMDLNGLTGRFTINGENPRDGLTDDPMGALAWCANLAAGRGRPLSAGQVVITGSVIPTFAVGRGDKLHFAIDGLGAVEARVA